MKRIASLVLILSLLLSCALADSFRYYSAQDAQEQALSAMMDCCFSPEYGGQLGRMIRWEQTLKYYVRGNPTNADIQTLENHICDLQLRVPNLPRILRVYSIGEANVIISFVKLAEMSRYVTGYNEGNWGYVHWNFNGSYQITRMEVGIATDVTNQRQRNHLIMEEFTQGLGVQDDLDYFSDSIYYRPWTEIQQPSEVDWQILNLLYSPKVKAGMTSSQVYNALDPWIHGR